MDKTLHFFLFCSLGSTRFFKVVRAKSQEGMIVVKVFAIHDPMLPLVKHRVRIDEIKSKLQSAVNCLCFQKVVVRKLFSSLVFIVVL